MICLFDLIPLFQSTIFQSCQDGVSILSCSCTKQSLKRLAQGHNAATPARLETTTPQSRDKHSTTKPPRSSDCLLVSIVNYICNPLMFTMDCLKPEGRIHKCIKGYPKSIFFKLSSAANHCRHSYLILPSTVQTDLCLF